MSIKSWASLLLLAMLWGGSFFLNEVALFDFPPLTMVMLRVWLAALCMLAVLKGQNKQLPRTLTAWRSLLIMGFLTNAFPFSLIVWGQVHVSGSVASILIATTPIFSAVLAHFFTVDEKMILNRFIGVLIGFCGVVVLLSPELLQDFSWRGYGLIAIITAAASYAASAVWAKRFNQVDPVVSTTGMLICSAIMLVPLAFSLENPLATRPSLISLGAVLMLGIASTAIAYMIFFRLIAVIGATNVTLVTYLMPVSAILLGAIFLDERLSITSIAGMGLIFSALLLIDQRLTKWIKSK